MSEYSLGKAAQAWCTEKNSHKEMDADLAEAFADILDGEMTPKKAIEILSLAFKEDYGYAWSWHCNLAMMAQDAGAPHSEANARAAIFMRQVFDIDTSEPPK